MTMLTENQTKVITRLANATRQDDNHISKFAGELADAIEQLEERGLVEFDFSGFGELTDDGQRWAMRRGLINLEDEPTNEDIETVLAAWLYKKT